MNLESFYGNPRVLQLLKRYLDGISDVEELFKKKAKEIDLSQCIIAVLGMQGCGKSSFLNALLFGDIVLPVDADETTCIPAEVSYEKNSTPIAIVYFSDGKEKTIACTEDSLADYIHQDRNPANRKGVTKVVIKLNHPLLEKGVTFVDLPGVGSITAANQETTMDYIKKSTAAVFLLRTMPPITHTESVFIQGALPLFGYVFWLQNQWFDETADEVRDGMEHNTRVLASISKQIHYPEDRIHAPAVVNIKKALDGKIQNRGAEIRDSGIDKFMIKLTTFAADWKKEVEYSNYTQATGALNSAKKNAEEKIRRLSGDVQDEKKKIDQAQKKADEILLMNKNIIENAEAFLLENRTIISNAIKEKCLVARGNLRNAVREAIENGIVGGEHLNEVFTQHLNDEMTIVFQEIQPLFQDFYGRLQDVLSGIKETIDIYRPDISIRPDFSDKSKLPGYYGRIGVGAMGVGGAAVGLIWGPVGAVVGGLVGILLGGLAGAGAKKIHLDIQKEEAKKELFDHIRNLHQVIENRYLDVSDEFFTSVKTEMYRWLENQETITRKQFEADLKDLNKPVEEKQRLIKQIHADIEELQVFIKEIGGTK